MFSPFKFVLRASLTMGLLWVLATYLPQYVQVQGGTPAFLVIGAVLTILNMVVRPLLNLVALPLKLFATLVALILVNAGFLWIAQQALAQLAPPGVSLVVTGGTLGFVVIAFALGIGNWITSACS